MQSNTNPNAKYLEGLNFLLQTKTVKQIIFIFGLAISVALGIVLFMQIQEPTYRPLDYKFNEKNISIVVDTLDKSGIKYKINDKDNIIYVSSSQFTLAKIKLAAVGIQKEENEGYSFLNEQNGYTNTQFLQNARYLRALEGDLEKTINQIQGIISSNVHIAIPQQAVFADENSRVTASVMVTVGGEFGASDRDKIRSIMHIVAGSVPELDPNAVSITDQYGHLLSESIDQDGLYSSAQLTYQNKVETYYEKRIESLISPLVGQNRLSVKVYANIDFSKNEVTKENYNPDEKVVRNEQMTSEESHSGKASGAPGSLSNTPSDEEGSAGSSSSTGEGRKQTIKNYEIGKSISYQRNNGALIKKMSVAIVVDNEKVFNPKTKTYAEQPLSPEKLAKIKSLAEAVIGFSSQKGDTVTVVNSSFAAIKQETVSYKEPLWEKSWFWDLIKKSIGIILGFVFLFFLSKKLLNFFNQQNQMGDINYLEHGMAMSGDSRNQYLREQQMMKLKQMASNNPDKIASVIRTWVGKA